MVLKVFIFKDGKGGREVVSIYMLVAGTATSRDWVGDQRIRRKRESRQRTYECSKEKRAQKPSWLQESPRFLCNSSFLKLLGALGRGRRSIYPLGRWWR